MSNEQLHLLLQSMLAELDTAIDGAREAMPEGAERELHTEWQRKPEYRNYLLFTVSEETHDRADVEGEYLALLPLVALRDAWAERFEALKTQGGES